MLVVVAVLLVAQGPSRADGSGAKNPLHPAQCDEAIRFATQRIALGVGGLRERMLVADGELCRGLSDDPKALDRAIRGFRAVLDAAPGHFHAQLALADALSERYPLSDEALAAYRRALGSLRQADVGAARGELLARIADAIVYIAKQQEHFRTLLEGDSSLVGPGQSSALAHAHGRWLQMMARTGPRGEMHAIANLEAGRPGGVHPILATFYLAELLRARAADEDLLVLYRQAMIQVCRAGDENDDHQACSLATRRMAKLQGSTE